MAEFEVAGPGFTDRKTRLVVLGILQIILGGLCALMAPLMVFGMIMAATVHKSETEAVSLKMMIPGLLFYVLLAVWFIWIGIGSVTARRWARALIVVSSWLWLICGAMGFAFVLMFMPHMYEQMAESGKMPPEAVAVMKVVMMAFLAVFYIVIPGLLALFYSGRDVKATCEYRDPQLRWTDKCPLPVLAVSVVCAVWAVSMLSMGAYGWAIPFFGTILNGMAGAIVISAFILLLAYTARGLYRQDNKAWWVAVLVIAGWAISYFITFSNVSMQTFYEKMNFPEQQLNKIKQYSTVFGPAMKWVFGLWAVVIVGYFAYIRRYFSFGQGGDKEVKN